MAELAEHVPQTRLGLLAPAILVEVRAGGIVIDAASGASHVQPIFLPAEASAIEEDADTLWDSGDSAAGETPERDTGLKGVPELVVRRDARQPCQGFLDRHESGAPDFFGRDDLDARGDARRGKRRGRKPTRRG